VYAGQRYEPVAIGRLERFVADWEAAAGLFSLPILPAATHKKVAVVGSGPAGLTVAADLARFGHNVTIFEALHEAGGVLSYGIPEFRLPKAIVKREVDYVRSMGVRLRIDFVVGSSATVDELLENMTPSSWNGRWPALVSWHPGREPGWGVFL